VEYEEFVCLVCDTFGLDRSEVNEETSFLHDLGIDSLSLSNFIIKLEHQYHIKINITNVWDLKSMRDAYEQFTHALATVESPGDGIQE
jgi:acyl carrier protein